MTKSRESKISSGEVDGDEVFKEILEEMNLEDKDKDRMMEWWNSPEEAARRTKSRHSESVFKACDFDFFDDESLFSIH